MFSREGFSRFLVQSPLVCYPPPKETPPQPGAGQGGREEAEAADFQVPYGSYHQLYRLDGRLIAVRTSSVRFPFLPLLHLPLPLPLCVCFCVLFLGIHAHIYPGSDD